MKNNIETFFRPKSIALIGASEIEQKVGGILLKKIIKSKVKVIPVNPQHGKILGINCYKNILDYKGHVDLAVIAIPSLFVIGALNECGKKGIKNVIIISAGFSEIGNTKGEEELVSIAKKYDIKFIGTNCFGICDPKKNLDLTFSATIPSKGDIAFVSQSGALWSYISDFSASLDEKQKFGFSNFVSLGNMADLEFSDFIEYFSKDKATKSIVLYVEKLKDGKRFMNACKKCSKPIYAVKAGSSEKGSEAAFSHTASIASDYDIYRAAFKQSKVVLCDGLLDAFEKASGKKFVKDEGRENVKIGRKVFILTNAGGAGALLADYLSKKGFSVVDKPLDLLGTASGSDYFNALEKLKTQTFYDSIAVVFTAQSMSETVKTAEAIAEFKKQSGKHIVALFLGGKSMKEANKILQDSNVPYFNTLEEARSSLTI